MASLDFLPGRIDTRDSKLSKDEQNLLGYLDDLQKEGERHRDRWAPKEERERDVKLYRGHVGPKSGEAFFKGNFIQTFVDRMVQQLTDNRPILRVESRKLGLKPVAQVLGKACDAVWEEAKMQRQTFKMAHNAAITRSAGIYTGYDPSTDEIVLDVVKPSQVIFDPAVEEAALMSRAEYLAIDRIRPLSELVYKFPGRGGFVKADANVTLDPASQTRRSVTSALTDLLNGTTQGGDTLGRAHVWEWCLVDRQRGTDGKPLFPNGRRIFRTKDRILWDGPNPFWDADHPLDWFDFTVDPEHAWGISVPSLLMELQIAFNQLGSGLVENQILSNFLTVIADHDALDPQTWKKLQAITSSIILRKRSRNAMAPTVTPPPSFGADKIAILRWIFTIAQMLTGVTDVTLGETPGSLQSGTAIEGLVEGANLGTRARASRMEDFFGRVGQKLLARVFQFWTCTDPETECLTKRGWLRYDQLQPNDELYTLNAQTEQGEWSPLLYLNVWDYDGEMYRIEGHAIDALVTPNHKWAVKNTALRDGVARRHRWRKSARQRWGGGPGLSFFETAYLNTECTIPVCAPLGKDTEETAYTDAFVELIGWLVTEGSYYPPYSVEVSQSERANPEKCATIRACLESNGVKWRERKDKNDVIRFTFSGPLARQIVRDFPGKTLTYDFIVSLPKRQLELLYETMIDGDGCRSKQVAGKWKRSTYYYSSNPVLADQFQMVAVLLGRATRTSRWPTKHLDRFDVRVCESKSGDYVTWRKLKKKTTVQKYSGKVWCPTTTTGTWVARRNGRVYVTGNSEKVISLVGPSGAAMEYAIKRAEFFIDDKGQPLTEANRVEALKWHRFIIQPGSSMAGTRLRRGQLMKDLVLLGAASREDLLAEAGFQNPSEMLDRAKKEYAEFSAAGFVPPSAAKTGK